ncbi:MAG: VanW family protein [Candidatus Gottesmanbacteria bacterium]
MQQELVSLALLGLTLFEPVEPINMVGFNMVSAIKPLASQSMDMTNRYPDKWVNEVFSDNILLSLHYLKGDAVNNPNWEKTREPFQVDFTLKSGDVFAFHDVTLPEYKDKVVKTMNSHFMWDEGYKSDGWLIGDGVCHLATLMNWVASEAGLKVIAKANHDFRPVPDIDRKYGTSIFYGNVYQNLYIENTLDYSAKFEFKIDPKKINLSIIKI